MVMVVVSDEGRSNGGGLHEVVSGCGRRGSDSMDSGGSER